VSRIRPFTHFLLRSRPLQAEVHFLSQFIRLNRFDNDIDHTVFDAGLLSGSSPGSDIKIIGIASVSSSFFNALQAESPFVLSKPTSIRIKSGLSIFATLAYSSPLDAPKTIYPAKRKENMVNSRRSWSSSATSIFPKFSLPIFGGFYGGAISISSRML
jgi:hypothetical protein